MLTAWSLSLLMRRVSAASRHFFWTMIIAGLLLLPVISLVSPKISVDIQSPLDSTQVTKKPPVASHEEPFRSAIGTVSDIGFSDSSIVNIISPVVSENQTGDQVETTQLAVPQVLLLMWIVGAFTVGTWIVAGWFRVRLLVGRYKESADTQLEDLCRTIAGEMKVKRPFRLMIAERAMMPLVVGWKEAVLIVPVGIGQWDSKRQKAVIFHEIGHIQRYDCLTQLAGQIFCAIYWFHPLSWLINQKLRSEAEAACDDLAIRSGSEPSEYAEHLLHIAKSFKGHRILSFSAAPMAGSPKLENRMRQILATGINRKKMSKLCAMLCISAAIGFTLVSSTIQLSANSEPNLQDTPLNQTLGDSPQPPSRDIKPVPQSSLLTSLESGDASQDRESSDVESNLDESASAGLLSGKDSTKQDLQPIRGSGTLQSPTVVEVRSELDKPTEILWISQEGQHVKKGDLILEFESSKLIEELETRQIEIATDQAGIESTKQAMIQTHLNNDSGIVTLELNLRLAELDRQKGKSEFDLKLRKAENELSISRKRLEQAELNYSVTKTRFEAGHAGNEDLNKTGLQVEEAQSKLEIAAGEQKNLLDHVRIYETTAHELAIQQAESALQQAKAQNRNKVAAAGAELESLKVVHKIKTKGLNRLEKQISQSKIYAPQDGMIVYSPWQNNRVKTRLQAGSIVRKNQPLMRLHDVSQFEIWIQLNKSQIAHTAIGQPAAIHVDSQLGREYQGKVTRISKIPDPVIFARSGRKYFRLTVAIEDPSDAIRPGMTATVELLPGQ